MRTARTALLSRVAKRPDIGVGGAAAVLAAAAATIYLPILARLGRQWFEDPNAAYGLLVAIAAIVAVWQRWQRLRTLPVQSSWSGGVALAAAAALYAVATLAADVFLLRASCVVFAVAVIWFVLGAAHVRILAAPFVLCFAAIPLPAAVVTELTMPLQLLASQFAAVLLDGIGFEVVRDGNVLTLSHITLEVAEACSGLRSQTTLLALVAVYWGTGGPPPWRVAVLAAATVPVALVANGVRVVATAMLSARIGEDAVRGIIHDATGFAAFLAMCTTLAGIHLLASRFARACAAST